MNVNEQDLGTTDVFIDLFGIYTSERLRRTDVVRTRLFGRNAKGHVPLGTSLTANTKLTAKPLMRSIVNGCMYANMHRFTTARTLIPPPEVPVPCFKIIARIQTILCFAAVQTWR